MTDILEEKDDPSTIHSDRHRVKRGNQVSFLQWKEDWLTEGMVTMSKIRLSFFRPSTRAFLRTARQAEDFSLFDLLHGYVYARWPYLYIGIGVGEHPLAPRLARLSRWITAVLRATSNFKEQIGLGQGRNNASEPLNQPITFADTYHGKVVPLAAATQLVRIPVNVEIRNLEQIILYARARDIVMKNPDHIVALECPCRAVRVDIWNRFSNYLVPQNTDQFGDNMNALDVMKYGHLTFLNAQEGLEEADYSVRWIGGEWSLKDVVAHTASFEEMLVEILAAMVAGEGEQPLLRAMLIDHQRFNAEQVARRREKSVRDLLDEYQEHHARVMLLLQQLPVEKMRQPGTLPWYGEEYDLEDFLVYTFYGHKREHSTHFGVYKDVKQGKTIPIS